METHEQTTERVKHPAKFSPAVLGAIREIADGVVGPESVVLDPFAGVGGIHTLADPMGWETWGVEIEREWAQQHPRTVWGDSTTLGAMAERDEIPARFDAIVTSPAYGNRMADGYAGDAKGSKRYTYRTALGRDLTMNNGASLQWGPRYMALHRQVWRQCSALVRPHGHFILNVSDHIRKGMVMPVVKWHVGELVRLGWNVIATTEVETPRNRHGANRLRRVPAEQVVLFGK